MLHSRVWEFNNGYYTTEVKDTGIARLTRLTISTVQPGKAGLVERFWSSVYMANRQSLVLLSAKDHNSGSDRAGEHSSKRRQADKE